MVNDTGVGQKNWLISRNLKFAMTFIPTIEGYSVGDERNKKQKSRGTVPSMIN